MPVNAAGRALAVLLLSAALLQAGRIKIWVTLSDKGSAPADLFHAGPPGSADLRSYENLPLYPPYLAALSRAGLAVQAGLKWQNRVSGMIEASRLGDLRALACVASIAPMPRKARAKPLPRAPFAWRPLAKPAAASADSVDYGAARALHDSLKVSKLHAWLAATGQTPGQGMRVAVIDADFHLGSPIFADMKTRIRDQYDFAGHQAKAVDDKFADSHGAECMSLIGGNLLGTYVGAAPYADFLLYRAEINDSELYVEEDYVAAAIERAVDSGAQVINISLGYRYEYDSGPDLAYSEFDGRTRPSSLAALGAARRNVVVSIAMGNLPDSTPVLPSLTAPADADSVLSVGIEDRLRRHCSYSCTGPSADGRVKPEVVSMGIGTCTVAVADPNQTAGTVANYAGTSFAAPAVAGVALLLRQLRPDATAEEVRQALIRTADRYDRPDGLVGHGLVDAAAAARALGLPIEGGLVRESILRVFHVEGAPIVLGWDPGKAKPTVQLIDPAGRIFPVTSELVGPLLRLMPKHPLSTGVYVVRIP